MRKSQSALEYLMVYGWVFIIIVVVGAALFLLGVFDPNSDLSAKTEESFSLDDIGVYDHQLLINGTWVLSLYSRGYDVTITKVIIGNESFNFNQFITPSSIKTITGNLSGFKSSFGDIYEYEMHIEYIRQSSEMSHTASGVFTGIVEAGSLQIITIQQAGSFYQTTQADFSQGTTSSTDVTFIPDSVVLSAKTGWFDNNYKNRITAILTEESGNTLNNYPASITINTQALITAGKMQNDGDDLRIVVDGVEVPRQFEPGTLNTAASKIWFLANLSSYESKQVQIYYNNFLAQAPVYGTDLSYSAGTSGYFENSKLYARIGNNNNPNNWGFDTIYAKNIGRDLVNYYSYLFNRDNSQTHTVTSSAEGPVFVELTMTGSGNELNQGPLVYRLYSKNNFIRWQYDSVVLPGQSFYIGTDNTEINKFESNNIIHTLGNYTYTNLQNSYVRLFNESSNYGIVMTSPVYLNQAVVTSSDEEWMGLSNNTQVSVEYFDYYIGAYTLQDCSVLAQISNNQALQTLLSEDSVYQSSGEFTSNAYKTGVLNPDYTILYFAGEENAYTDIKLRLRTASTEEGLASALWYGPTSTTDYYTLNSTINNVHDGDEWLQYRVYLSNINGLYTPVLDYVTINYS
ncbi:MAG: hypothetical protein JW791_03895 [Nanoarchaeota archaeon]|nr:hypothetical protein [Nanoarchaeota archaeon]